MEDFILQEKKYLVEVLGKKLIDSDEFDNNYRRLAKKYWPEEFNDGTKKHVHHIDFDRTNNVVSNLVVLTQGEHQRIHFLFDPNFTPSMKGKHHSEESIEKMSEKAKGRPSPMKGKSPSEETRRKQSESMKGKYVGENNPFYGKHHSEETIRKLSKKAKGRPSPMYGKHHSEETCKKISENVKKRITPESIQKMSKAKKDKHWKLVDGKRVWY